MPMHTNSDARVDRWREEASFFDGCADKAREAVSPIDPLTLERYGHARLRRRFSEEFRFRLLRNLREKRVLDVGCGDGKNAVVLAKLGARVTGIDVASGAIDLARERARISGVADTAHFVCSPLEVAEFSANSFDVIWGDAILHHVIPELDTALSKLTYWAKPDSLMLFTEPVNLNTTLRRIRLLVPVHTNATPGERPLEAAEINLIRNYIPDLALRPFSLLGRLDRFVLKRHNFERSSLPRRIFVGLTASLDYPLLSLPGLRNLGAKAVMYGHPRKVSA